jgi:hypothetical protein
MILNNLCRLLLAGIVAAVPLSHGIAHPVGAASATEAGVVTVQGWPGWQSGPGWSPDQERREHCWRLRNRAREIRDRMYYAPPWEREQMERHLWEFESGPEANAGAAEGSGNRRASDGYGWRPQRH